MEEELIWKVLSLEAEAVDVIRAWYNAPSEAEQDRMDVPCVDFDKYVHCIEFQDDNGVMEMDVSTLHPVNDALFIFYTHRTALSKLYVLGALTWETLVLRDKGNVRSHALEKTRMIVSKYHPLVESCDDEHVTFWFPYVISSDSTFTRDECAAKMEWYRNGGGGGGGAYSSESEPALHVFARRMLDAIEFDHSTTTDVEAHRRLAYRYGVMRMVREGNLFFDRMSKVRGGESELISLLKFNGWTSDLLSAWTVDGNVLDFKAFMTTYPEADYVPTIYFNIPLEDVPMEVAVCLPKYKGGRIHLPCYWKCVAEWIWNLFVASEHEYINANRARPRLPINDDGGPLHQIMKDETKKMCHYLNTHSDSALTATNGNKSVNVGRELRMSLTDDELNKAGADITDIEDIWRAAPPCISALKNAGRFPRHWERIRFVQTMHHAGINISTMYRLLSGMNDAYPRDGRVQTLKSRFDLVYTLKKNMGEHWCKNTINDTRLKHADTLQCPFVSTVPEAATMDGDELRSRCSHACSGRTDWKGPHLVMRDRLKNVVKKEVEVEEEEEEEEEEGVIGMDLSE